MNCSNQNLRPCESADGEKLLFHRWVLNQYVQNAYLQGQIAGQVSELFALCENAETGEVSYYYPNRIRFTDHNEQGE